MHINRVTLFYERLTGKPICNGLPTIHKFPLNIGVIVLELLPKQKTISCSFNVSSDAYYDCAWKISCEDRIAVEASINLDSGIHIHNTVHKNYAVECTYLPGFLNIRQPFIMLSHQLIAA